MPRAEGFSSSFHGCSKGGSRVFHGYFKGVLWVFFLRFRGVAYDKWMLNECFKSVSNVQVIFVDIFWAFKGVLMLF